jgi:hypothetical protein
MEQENVLPEATLVTPVTPVLSETDRIRLTETFLRNQSALKAEQDKLKAHRPEMIEGLLADRAKVKADLEELIRRQTERTNEKLAEIRQALKDLGWRRPKAEAKKAPAKKKVPQAKKQAGTGAGV